VSATKTREAAADRTRAAILAAALQVLGEDPGTGMAEVAHAAGVGRATLYRYFPTRDALEEAIRARARADLAAVLAAARSDDGDPAPALERLAVALLQIGQRYRALQPSDEGRARGRALVEDALAGLVRRAQNEGLVDRAIPVARGAALFRGLVAVGFDEVRAGRLDVDGAARLAVRVFLGGTGPAAVT
jgi:AcrR family transcriptional regulator